MTGNSMTQIAKFKYTFPITKAEKRADGLYITGYASGPEVDSEGERMAPEAIERFAAQINATSDDDRLVYRDAHAPDGVLRDLGDITKAWVTEKFHLGVEVKLDEANPAANYLFKQLSKGKQYGMSVAGHVVDYVDEVIEGAGHIVRTYKNVVLDEISNTTRPAWYPSFGSVLSKSVKEASETASEVNMSDTAQAELGTAVEDATKSDEAIESAEDTTKKADDAASTDSTEKAADDAAADDTTEKADESADEVDVEKAGRRVSAATAAELRAMHEAITTALTAVGVIEAPVVESEAEKSADKTGEDTTEKSSASTGAESTELAELRKALEQATARIATLEAQPTAKAPGAITDTSKSDEDLVALLAKASPAERLRIALASHTGGR